MQKKCVSFKKSKESIQEESKVHERDARFEMLLKTIGISEFDESDPSTRCKNFSSKAPNTSWFFGKGTFYHFWQVSFRENPRKQKKSASFFGKSKNRWTKELFEGEKKEIFLLCDSIIVEQCLYVLL